ncbi:restriction endonuclease subunit S [Galactobacter valiniphilus]|uniref:Restriction endonuclease subunit S n=1 Tax=Galactobacter valiniphilus TaxID=2676122 RepID=A0A399JDF1_9MICC|nr:restriction endonuclease subunit S [Galactobacter valiniphilus]RII43578.1 restriction endonuclease subunit S [Galactobacter valiniphilus]
MTEWPTITLGEICRAGGGFIRTGPFGSQLHRSDYTDDPDGIPVVMPKDMARGRIDTTTIARIDDSTAARLQQHLLSANDVVLSRRGDVGRTAWVFAEDLPAFCGTGSMRVHPGKSETVRPAYLRFFFHTRLASDYLEGHAVGATMPNLNAGIVERMPVPIPPLAIQDSLVTVLEAFDDLIENNRRRVAVLEEMARAIYREWFVKFRYPGYEDVPLVDSTLGPLPEGWQVCNLSEIAGVNRSSRKPASDEVFRYLDITALGEREIGALNAVEGANAPGRARRVLNPGDTVWATVRPNRRAHALAVAPAEDWIASTGLAVLTPTTVSSAFLFETTSTTAFSNWLVGRATGSAYPAVRAIDFEEAAVAVPDAAVDAAFAEKVNPMHELSWTLRAESSSLAELRDLLLPKLVTGQIDVSALDLDALVGEGVGS